MTSRIFLRPDECRCRGGRQPFGGLFVGLWRDLLAADGIGIGIDFKEMVDTSGVALIVGDSLLDDLLDGYHKNACLSTALYYTMNEYKNILC